MDSEIKNFIANNDLEDFLKIALKELNKAFGYKVSPGFWIFQDPDDGSCRLMVEIVSDNPKEADQCLMSFCHDWWFDRLSVMHPFIGFRVSGK